MKYLQLLKVRGNSIMSYEYCDLIMNAGRVLNPIEINEILFDMKRNIFNLVSLLQYKIIVIDFDGTMCEFKYTNTGRLLPCKDSMIKYYTGNLYENVRVLKAMQFVLYECDPIKMYVLTISQDSVKNDKTKMINSKFPMIRSENIIHVKSVEDKMLFLEELYEKYRKRIIFLEDTANTLIDAEERFDFVQGYHISSLIP